jgi:Methyltransferase domain
VKPVVWTRDLVARFWDGVAETRLSDEMAFAALNGEECLQVFSPFLDRSKSYIDFGGGDGHFAKLLCAHGYKVAIYDISEGRSHRASKTLAQYGGAFLGRVGPESAQKFAGVFCLEVAEHVLDSEIASTCYKTRDLPRRRRSCTSVRSSSGRCRLKSNNTAHRASAKKRRHPTDESPRVANAAGLAPDRSQTVEPETLSHPPNRPQVQRILVSRQPRQGPPAEN